MIELANSIHFIRPWAWLMLPLLIVLIFILHRRQQHTMHGAHALFDHTLLAFLTRTMQLRRYTALRVANYLCAVLVTIALAGPSLPQAKQSAITSTTNTVLVVDLSLSMLATDLAPNRLTQAKFVLKDLINALDDHHIGLVVYSQHAFTLMPVTSNRNLLLTQLDSIHPDIMPSKGSRPLPALKLASDMLQQSLDGGGQIIWITDDVTDVVTDASGNTANHLLSTIVIGTERGATIRLSDGTLLKDKQGQVVLHTLESGDIEQLNQRLDQRVSWLNGAGIQLANFIDQIKKENNFQLQQAQQAFIQPTDLGVHFLYPVLFVVILALLQKASSLYLSALFAATLSINLGTIQPVSANMHGEIPLWMAEKNPAAVQAFNEQRYADAAVLFNDVRFKAIAHMAMSECDTAAKLLVGDSDPVSAYNLANCLVADKRYEDALSLYDTALSLNPQLVQAAQNKEAVLAFLQSNQKGKGKSNTANSEQSEQQPQSANASSQQQNESSQNGQQQNSPQSELANADSQATSGESSTSSNQQASRQQSEQRDAQKHSAQTDANEATQDAPSSAEQTQLSSRESSSANKQQQYINALINRVPDEPTFLLKSRLQLMYQRQLRSGSTSMQPGDNEETW